MLKLEGTYRKDRHSARDEGEIADLLPAPPPCPEVIKTAYVRAAWDFAIPPLVYTKRIAPEDMPIIETAFRALDDAERWHTRLVDFDPDDPRFASYSGAVKNYRQQFVDIMRRFGCTSQDRLTLLDVVAGMKRKRDYGREMTEESP